MSLSLRLFFLLELLVCCYGNLWPDEIGYYLSHRYWAGNWVQAFFWVKRTPEVKRKMEAVSQKPPGLKGFELYLSQESYCLPFELRGAAVSPHLLALPAC